MSAATSAVIYEFPQIGEMSMPADFRYKDILSLGRPRHEPTSRFRMKHPEMPCSRRAKIFAPFDALRGFSEAVASKEILYTDRPELSDYEKEDLDEKLSILCKLTCNRKAARENAPVVTVTYFRPCSDEQSDAYGTGGTIETVTGICSRIDMQISRTIKVGDHVVPLEDVTDITGDVIITDIVFADNNNNQQDKNCCYCPHDYIF